MYNLCLCDIYRWPVTLLNVLTYFCENSTSLISRWWVKYLLCSNVLSIQGFVIWQALSKTGNPGDKTYYIILDEPILGKSSEILSLWIIGSMDFYFLWICSVSSYNSGAAATKRNCTVQIWDTVVEIPPCITKKAIIEKNKTQCIIHTSHSGSYTAIIKAKDAFILYWK